MQLKPILFLSVAAVSASSSDQEPEYNLRPRLQHRQLPDLNTTTGTGTGSALLANSTGVSLSLFMSKIARFNFPAESNGRYNGPVTVSGAISGKGGPEVQLVMMGFLGVIGAVFVGGSLLL
ncbi:hypothetical protein QBC35DRAFT_4480 [Podospora australis]|uniref:Uncharacterized protein n=1 Tax=Podospora australis TaxID=1536484 RepID=A0AAN7AM25_9PEZI|nr:hypothetical protein QBC35DRAFT_4480 [Podospora australis]